MHIHQSVLDADGNNIFVDDKGEFSNAFMGYIAGLQRYTPELISLYAPNVNSYRRLAPEISAPINLNWGLDNRTVAFRVPNSEATARASKTASPARRQPLSRHGGEPGQRAAGHAGAAQASEPHQGTANEDDVEVARTLEEGLRNLRRTPAMCELFGDLFLRAYAAVKLDEFEEFNRVISSWEREHLLLQV
jgi:glutamine synthetase